jgi:plasmid replication initiation protein
MDSVYAIRFYGFCKEFERFGKFQFTVEEMRRMFNLENKYELYGLFKQKVVVKAQDELIKNSDLIFDFNEIKEGKKVVALQFVIRKNPHKTQAQLEIETTPTSQEAEDSHFEVLESNTQPNFESSTLLRLSGIVQVWGIDSSTIQNWLEQYPIEQVILGWNMCKQNWKKNPRKSRIFLRTLKPSLVHRNW